MARSASSLRSAENKLRDKAHALVRNIDKKYWELGRVLYEIYSGVPGGYRGLMTGNGSKTHRKAMFERWGYKNFGDYCERGLGLRKRTAENLRFAYRYFVIDQRMTPATIDQLISLGRSKVYLLSGVATNADIAFWLKRARAMSFDQLKTEVLAAKVGSIVRLVGSRRSLRVDVCTLVKYLYTVEYFLRRSGRKIPADVEDVMKWYENQAGVKVKLVA